MSGVARLWRDPRHVPPHTTKAAYAVSSASVWEGCNDAHRAETSDWTQLLFGILAAPEFVLDRLANEDGYPAITDKSLDAPDRFGRQPNGCRLHS